MTLVLINIKPIIIRINVGIKGPKKLINWNFKEIIVDIFVRRWVRTPITIPKKILFPIEEDLSKFSINGIATKIIAIKVKGLTSLVTNSIRYLVAVISFFIEWTTNSRSSLNDNVFRLSLELFMKLLSNEKVKSVVISSSDKL